MLVRSSTGARLGEWATEMGSAAPTDMTEVTEEDAEGGSKE